MGLYDGYRLSNSTGIPQYVGSALPEITKAFDIGQQTYDAAYQTRIAEGEAIQSAPVHSADKKKWEKMHNDFETSMKADIEAGNFEDMYSKVSQQARKTVNKLKPLAQQVANQQEYYKSLDDKEKGLTEWHKNLRKQQAEDAYAAHDGVQFDASGRIVPGTQYQGAPATKVIDVNEKIRQALSHMHEYANKNIRKGDDGVWQYETVDGWKGISQGAVDQVFEAGLANDPEWRAHNAQEIKLNTYARTRGVSDQLVMQAAAKEPKLAEKIKEGAANGYSPAQTFQMLIEKEEQDNLSATQRQYARGKAYEEIDQTRASGVGAGYATRLAHELAKEPIDPWTIDGPNTKLTNDEQDITKVREANTTLSNKVTEFTNTKNKLELQLSKSTDPEQTRQLRLQLEAVNDNAEMAKAALNRNEKLLTYAKDKQARVMGYTEGGYKQFVEEESTKLIPDIKKSFPDGLVVKGKLMPAEELAKAVVEGRVTFSKDFTGSSSYNPTTGGGVKTIDAIRVKDKDGNIEVFTNKHTTQVMKAVLDKPSRREAMEHGVTAGFKSQIADLSFKTQVIGIPKKDQEGITNLAKVGNKTFHEPGQFEQISSGDIPVDFKVVGISAEGTEDKVILQAEGLDEKGQPTGKYYDIRTKNTTIGEKTAAVMEKGTAAGKMLARTLKYGSGARQVQAMVPGDTMNLGEAIDGSGQTTSVILSTDNPAGGGIVYTLHTPEGKPILKDPKGSATDPKNHYKTTDPAKAGAWIDTFKGGQ